MAFSTFRGLMASQNGSSPPPPVLGDTFTSQTPWWVFSGSTYGMNGTVIPGKTANSDFYAVSGDTSGSGSVYAWVGHVNDVGYTTYNNSVTLTGNTGNGVVTGEAISTTSFIACWDGNGNNATAAKLTQSSGTLTIANNGTTVISSGANTHWCLVNVLDSTYCLFLSGGSSTSNQKLTYWNHSAWSAVQSNVSASAITVNNQQLVMKALSSSMSLIAWTDSSLVLNFATVDIISGTSITLNATVNTGITFSNGGPGMIALNSTQALITYYKSANTMGARVITCAGGGSVTVGSEFTTTLVTQMSQYFAPSIAPYGTKFVCFYQTYTGELLQAIELSVSGTTVSFGSAAYNIDSSGAYSVSANILPLSSAAISSTKLVVGYQVTGSAGVGSFNVTKVDVNNATPTWSSILNPGGAWTLTGAPGGSGFTFTQSPACIWIGTNRLLDAAISNNATPNSNLTYFTSSLFASSAGSAYYNSTYDTGLASGGGTMCLISPWDTGSTTYQRVLSCAIQSSGSTVTAQILKIDQGNNITSGVSQTFSATGIFNNGALGKLINLDNTNVLFLYIARTGGTIKGNIITVNTNSTINTISAVSTVYTKASSTLTGSHNNMQIQKLSSTKVLIMYAGTDSGTGLNFIEAQIVTISGTTITAGTPVSIYSGYTNVPSLIAMTAFPNATGVFCYGNDFSPATTLYGVGFTYSGSTITLGTPVTLDATVSMQNQSSGNGPNMIPLNNNNQAVLSYYDNNNSPNGCLRLITYNNINSITAGSVVGSATIGSIQHLIPTDSPNTFVHYYDGTSASLHNQYFRG